MKVEIGISSLFIIKLSLGFLFFFFNRGLPPPLKKQKVEEPSSDIPDVLQGEIARLDQRFKVKIDDILEQN